MPTVDANNENSNRLKSFKNKGKDNDELRRRRNEVGQHVQSLSHVMSLAVRFLCVFLTCSWRVHCEGVGWAPKEQEGWHAVQAA